MSKNYSIDHEPKLSNTMIMLPHLDENFFSWQAIQEFVEKKSLIPFNLADVIHIQRFFHLNLMRIRNENSEICNSRTWNNSFLVHCDIDLNARLYYIKLILK